MDEQNKQDEVSTEQSNGETCSICDKNIDKLLSGEITCDSCEEEGLTRIANLTVVGHILEGLISIFNFQFICALASFKWAQERLCKSGDYHPITGVFYVRKLIK